MNDSDLHWQCGTAMMPIRLAWWILQWGLMSIGLYQILRWMGWC